MFKDVCFDSGYLCHSETAHPTVNGRYLRNFTTLLGLILIIFLSRVAAALRIELADRKSPCTKAINKAVRSRPSKLLLTGLCDARGRESRWSRFRPARVRDQALRRSGTLCAGSNLSILQEPFEGLQASPLGNSGQRLHTVGGVDALTDESEQEKVEIFPGAPIGCEGHAMSL